MIAKTEHPVEVSIIIPSLDGLQLLKEYLPLNIDVLDDELGNNYEIIVADDGSQDETIEWLGSLCNSKVRGVIHQPPRGFGSNCNFAAQHAIGKYIFFLSNDVLLIKPFFTRMLEIILKSDVFAVVPSIHRPDEGIIESLTTGHLRKNKIVLQFKNKNNLNEDMVYPVYWGCGAALLCRRDLFEKIGGFSREFEPADSEDVDLSLRAWRSGYTVWYCGASKAHHWANTTTRKMWRRRKVRYLQIRNYYVLNLKHIPRDRRTRYVAEKFYEWLRKPKPYLIMALMAALWIHVIKGEKTKFTMSMKDVDNKIDGLMRSDQ